MSDTAIRIENLSKKYRLGVIGHGTLFRDIQSWIAIKRGKEDPHSVIGEERYAAGKHHFWALKDLNLDIKKGSRIAILGKNGAGKSTLLKILARITAPTEGAVKINGKIASLLEAGTGFHPELTGRENIYLQGAIQGMKKRRIDEKIDSIIEFSGIEHHVDTPVKRYSSGMSVRLGFSIAAHLDGDILIADEVLAVGDAEFRKRAVDKMLGLSTGEGRTVLFVSHNMESVRSLCNCGIVLERGKIKFMHEGNIGDVIGNYLEKIRNDACYWENDGTVGDEYFSPQKMYLMDSSNKLLEKIDNKDDVYVAIESEICQKDPLLNIIIQLLKDTGEVIFTSWLKDYNSPVISIGKNLFYIKLPVDDLNVGKYKILLTAALHYVKWIIPFDSGPEISFSKENTFTSEFGYFEKPGFLAPKIEWKNSI